MQEQEKQKVKRKLRKINVTQNKEEEHVEFDLEQIVGAQNFSHFYIGKEDKKIIQADVPERYYYVLE